MKQRIDQESSGEIFIEQSYHSLFFRFLRYGFLAWGGPIAQLALIEREMVFKENRISLRYFNRLIAIYQMVPGPETHEICVHLGTQAKGRWGGLLAGLGFMFPGFILMMLFSKLYQLYGLSLAVKNILWGIKPAVMAWLVKGGVQLSRGILTSKSAWLIAILACIAELYAINFMVIFFCSGVLYLVLNQYYFSLLLQQISHRWLLALLLLMGLSAISLVVFLFGIDSDGGLAINQSGSMWSTFLLGLQCGGLSFGSVYAILPIIKSEAIIKAHMLTQEQFIDGLALAGILPAPFIIVTTFVGYLAYGFWGGILITFGTFLIPFLIPLFCYNFLNRIGSNRSARLFLDGVISGAAGLIAAEIFTILLQVLISPLAIAIFIGSLTFIYLYQSLYAIIWIVLISGLLGYFFC